MRQIFRSAAFFVAPAVLALALSGCAQSKSYSSARPFRALDPQTEALQVNDEEIQAAFDAKSQLRLPASLAVYEYAKPSYIYEVTEENEHIALIREAFGGDPRIRRLAALTSTFVPHQPTPRAVRLAAAHHQADLVLLAETDFRVDVDGTPLGLLNLTIIGAFVVPSVFIEVEAQLAVHLIDTRNGRVYYSDVKTKKLENFRPAASGESVAEENRATLLRECWDEALRDLQAALEKNG